MLVEAGAGKEYCPSGEPPQPWTPEELSFAISSLEQNKKGVDLRTVQFWFQNNERGLSRDNIRWLAQIVGCDDSVATEQWHRRLIEGNGLQSRKRTNRGGRVKKHTSPLPKRPAHAGDALEVEMASEFSQNEVPGRLSSHVFHLFANNNFLLLPSIIWAVGALLCLATYAVGLGFVTYEPVPDVSKQIGFISLPNWTIDRLVFVALLCIMVGYASRRWVADYRVLFEDDVNAKETWQNWANVLAGFNTSFWVVAIVCVLVVFLMQWLGIHVRPLLSGDNAMDVVDWIRLPLIDPSIVSQKEVIVLAGLANLSSALAYFCLFSGFLLIIIQSHDFGDIAHQWRPEHGSNLHDVERSAAFLINTAFLTCLLGVYASFSIKLSADYLTTDARGFWVWLWQDFHNVFFVGGKEWTRFDQRPAAYVTSGFVLMISLLTFFFVCIRTTFSVTRVAKKCERAGACEIGALSRLWSLNNRSVINVVFFIFLGVTFFLLGQFQGFSLLLIIATFLSGCAVGLATHSIMRDEV